MTSGSSKKPSNRHYEVGYGKPPVSGRFVKGVSGNPRGRPKKDQAPSYSVDTSLRDRFLEEAQRSVTVLEGGAPIEMTAVSAVMRAELIAAQKGNSHAQRSILKRAERYGKERAEEIEREHATWRKYIEMYSAPGKEVPKGLLYPEDVVIEPGKPVWFRFGVDAEEAEKHWQTLCRFRDAFLIQSETDFRHHKKNSTPGHDHKVPASLVIAISANSMLPNRHKFDEE